MHKTVTLSQHKDQLLVARRFDVVRVSSGSQTLTRACEEIKISVNSHLSEI